MPIHFLNTPVGVICLIVIGVTSLINIYAHWVDDGLLGRLLYMSTAVTCAAGLVKYANSDVPYHIATTLLVLFTVKTVRNLSVRSARYIKYRKQINAKKHL